MGLTAQQGTSRWCVVWRTVGSDNNGPVVSRNPEELEVAWFGGVREVTGPNGQPIGSDVTLLGLAEELPVGSAVVEGRLQDLTNQTPYRQVYRVVGGDTQLDPTGLHSDVEVYLQKSKDRLPSLGDE